MRGKYAPLHRHLSNLDAREWATTFREVEKILGATLPPSARTYQEWWNPSDHTHTQARAWMVAGWEPAIVDIRAETVVFRRSRSSAHRSSTPANRPNRVIAPVSSTDTKASSARASPPFWRKLWREYWQDILGTGEAAPPAVIPAQAGIQRASEVRQLTTSAHRKIPNKSRLPFDIHHLIEGLSQSRPIFHSEADFQHALAWQIHKVIPDSQVRLEYPVRYDDSTMYLDIWLPMKRIAIELKYPTRMLNLKRESERFLLVDHGAQPPRRYDFLKDVQRLERVVAEKKARGGYAVLLTNHPYYWENPTQGWRTAIDTDFRLHEGRTISGQLLWSDRAGAGTMRGRHEAIGLTGSYDLHWRDYSRLGEGNNQQFRYLAVAVQ